MKQLIPFILFISLMPCVESEASESTLVKLTEEKVYDHYLDELFTLESRFHLLPKDIQYLILSYLPNPFRPINPQNMREIVYEDLGLGILSLPPVLTRSEDAVLIFRGRGFLIESLDGSYRSEPILLPFDYCGYALNDDHTKMVILSTAGICEFTLDEKYIPTLTARIDLPEIKRMVRSDIKYLSNDAILFVTGYKEVVIWDSTRTTIEKITTTPPTEHFYGDRWKCIHPQGLHILYGDDQVINIFDIVTRKWGTVEGLKLVSSSKIISLSYNNNGSFLLVREEYQTPCLCPDKTYPKLRAFEWDVTGEKPVEVVRSTRASGNPIYTSHDNFFYIGESEEFSIWNPTEMSERECAYELVRILSSKTKQCLVALEYDEFAKHVLIDKTFRYIIADNRRTLRIWQANQSWVEADEYNNRSYLLSDYLFVRYLHFLGRSGLTLNKNGLCVQQKFADRFSSLQGGPNQEEVGQLLDTYNSFEEPVKEYLRHKYGVLSSSEGMSSTKSNLLKLLTFAAVIGYAGTIMKYKYASKKREDLSSCRLGDALVEENN